MIIESGCIVALGLILTFFKCSWKIRMKMLSNPLAMDLLVFVLLNVIHWGTFSGVMVAATGSLICSGMISLGRYVYGHVDKGLYFAGMFDVIGKLK